MTCHVCGYQPREWITPTGMHMRSCHGAFVAGTTRETADANWNAWRSRNHPNLESPNIVVQRPGVSP